MSDFSSGLLKFLRRRSISDELVMKTSSQGRAMYKDLGV